MRWSFWDEMRRMQNEMNKMFENFFTNETLLPARISDNINWDLSNFREPLSDILEDEKDITVKMEVPGVDKNDIVITTKDGGLEIKVQRKDEFKEEDKRKGFYRFERRYSGFYRYLPLPENADTENINATYKNGILELKIPKKQVKEEKRKRIEVK